MDPVSGLKAEVLRPLVAVLIPGLFASAPYVAIACLRYSTVERILGSPLGGFLICLVVGIFVGMIMENLGSRLEHEIWSPKIKKLEPWKVSTPELDLQWRQYLQLNIKDEIVGQRYLKTILTRLKFELAMVPSIFCFAIGVVIYDLYTGTEKCIVVLAVLGIAAVLMAYFIWEARESIQLLASIRKDIIDAVKWPSR